MRKSLRQAFLLFGLTAATFGTLRAQQGASEPPVSFLVPGGYQIATFRTPRCDVSRLIEEDRKAGPGLPFRFGYPFDVSVDLRSAGTWEALPDGARMGRLRIECPGAFSINLLYDRFFLPPGGRLWLYDDEGHSLLGPFTEENNKPSGLFATGVTAGEACTVEYYEPPGWRGAGEIHISRIVYGYRDIFTPAEKESGAKSFGDAGFCNVDVACPQGVQWQDEARAVGLILVWGGTAVCTGALLNNAEQDWTPYFLTAEHCLGPDTEQWVVVFNYQSPTCQSRDVAMDQTITGVTVRSRDSVSDFALCELSRRPPASYGVFYAGWSAVNVAPAEAACIHHPRGDVKKISFESDPLLSSVYPWDHHEEETHWKVRDWDIGTTEPGSSGAPLFDQNHRVVGQLTGGLAACTNDDPDYFGKLALAWERGASREERLRDWLDPLGTGILVLHGAFAPNDPPTVAITRPQAEAAVAGTVVVEAAAQDDVGIQRVEFYVDSELGGTDRSEPYSYRWESGALPLGPHSLEVVAVDVTGLSARAGITVYRHGVGVATGDGNCDGVVNVADAVCLLSYLFGPPGDSCKDPCCEANLDANDDHTVNVADAISVLNFLFSGQELIGPDGNRIVESSCRHYKEAGLVFPCQRPCN